ncbi:MAG: GDYXXLXY domain-containing protein [Elusimicrobiales bacterium]|nr:GDYXXLXY domain-containing protein [Elusimicrobiales bacterium]
MNKIRAAAVAQLIFFAAWAVILAVNESKPSATIWLETLPVDPRDFLSGNYVQLDYFIERPEEESCKKFDSWPKRGKQIAVQLVPGNEIRLSGGETATAYKAAHCQDGSIGQAEKNSGANDNSVWIQAYGTKGAKHLANGYLSYKNLNRYYMNENDKKLNLRSGRAAVQVQKNKNGSLKIIRLEELDQEKQN